MKKPREKSPFEKSRAIEEDYARSLRKIAAEVGRIVSGYDPLDPSQRAAMDEALRKYADILLPWARSKAMTMIARINDQDEKAWRKAAGQISAGLRDEVLRAPTGEAMRTLLAGQVELITSLPVKAAERVHSLAQKAVITGSRSKDFVAEIMRTGEVTKARAVCIARTETSRASATLTEVRAKHVGSTHYVWQTSRDGDVRPSHKAMQGVVVAWDDPPTLDGMTGHAGCLVNCRCFPSPLLSDTTKK